MKILLTLHHDLDRDRGAAGGTLRLADGLRALGHDVDVVGLELVGSRLPAQGRWLAFPWALARTLARSGHDVVEAATGDAWVWGSLRRRRSPVLVTRSHGLEHLYHRADLEDWRRRGRRPPLLGRAYWGGWRLFEVARSLRAADHCLFINDEERDHAVEHLGVARDRTGVVPYGVADEFLARPRPAPHDGPMGVAVVGALDGVKGGRRCVAALVPVLRSRPAAHVSMLGTDPEDVVLAAFPPDVRDRVRVVPRYDNADLPRLLEGHEVFLTLPRAEGFGIAIVEAMACGLVPVSSAAAGPRRTIRDGVDGVLVGLDDVAGATERVCELLDDPDRRLRMRRAAYERAQGHAWTRVAQQHVDEYRRALDRVTSGTTASG